MAPSDLGLPPGAWERDERAVAWIYGSILAGAAVVVAANVIATRPGQVVLYTALTMVVVWLAHAYAAFVGHGGRLEVGRVHRRALHALATEIPLLAAAIPTLVATAALSLFGAGVGATGVAGLSASIATMVLTAAAAARGAGAGVLGMAAASANALLIGGLLVAAKVALK